LDSVSAVVTDPKTPTASVSRVPFLDLAASHGPLARDILDDIAALVETGAFTNGPAVAAFEHAFAAYCGAAHCVGAASGLDALRIALVGLGVQAGDEVLVPAMTFVATFEAVTQAGATPVPVDVSLSDSCIDVEAITAAIGERTRAIMPVHLYGRLADMEAIGAVARSHGLIVVEDACQAHGARRNEVGAGKAGDAAAFSFYPGKNLGAFGDAGALVTDDEELAGQARALREHGQRRKYEHDVVGWTSRLDTIQATVLARKLPHLDAWNDERRRIADLYSEGLAGIGDLALPDVSDRGQVWHLFVVRTADPGGLASHLAAREIGTGRHYPEPPHLSRAYAHLGVPEGSCPNAERIGREALSLPIFPGMTDAQAEQVTAGVRLWFGDA
jgi:dTDP-3-amino-3,4,6-trideoxy-alpha-D-glucose transaminase